MTFDEAFARVIGHEGGYTTNPKDRGNWTSGVIGKGELKGTKYGIAAHAYPGENIASLSLERAKLIYRRDYWNKLRLDELPEPIRFDLFDTAINSGVDGAVRILQRALRVTEDGKLGPVTLAEARSMDPEALDARLAGERLLYLCSLKTFPDFGRGWVRRVASNLIED